MSDDQEAGGKKITDVKKYSELVEEDDQREVEEAENNEY